MRISGRSLEKNGVRYIDYTNSFIEFEFVGTSVSAEIISDLTPPEDIYRAWAGVCVNGETIPSKIFKIDEKKAVYELYRSDKPQKTKIRLMKLSEAAFAKLGISEIHIDGELLLPPKPEYERRIEFVGDSITCGYGIDGIWNKDVFPQKPKIPSRAMPIRLLLNAKQSSSMFPGAEWVFIPAGSMIKLKNPLITGSFTTFIHTPTVLLKSLSA